MLTPKLMPLISVIFISLWVVSCANKPIETNAVALSNTVNYQLQPVPELLVNKGIQALLEIKHNKSDEQVLIQVEMTSDNILVSGMTVEGFSLFNIEWQVNTNLAVVDKVISIDPLRILAELQLSLWPVDVINQGLSSALIINTQGLKQTAHTKQRTVLQGKTVLYTITQNNNVMILLNKQQDYALTIKELARWELSEIDNISPEKERP
jgi:hypothetical protein